MPEGAKGEILRKYSRAFSRFGYSPKALGWDKGNQATRFRAITSFFSLRGKRILDIGCGFGDLNRFLMRTLGHDYAYTGIDLVGDFVTTGRETYQADNIKFIDADFLDYQFSEKYDIVLGSGLFNQKFLSEDNLDFRARLISKAWNLCEEGIAFDFLSTHVEFTHPHTFHNDPEEILRLGYSLSRRISLRNDYMPFEFCLFVGKRESFTEEKPVFVR